MGGWLKYRANSLMLTGASQISGVGVWVSAPELFPRSDRPSQTSPELGLPLAATAADSTANP